MIYNRTDYLHDANGNRTAMEWRFTKGQVEPDTVDSYALTPGTNRLASITTASLTRTLIYDNRGNLSTETRGPAVTATTAYDGHGRLIGYSRTSEDSLVHTYNGLDDRIATARTPSGGGNADIRRFVTAPDGRAMGDDGLGGYMPIALATAASGGGTTLNWVHGDHLGTPIVITDASGIAIPQPGGYYTPAFPGQSRTLADLYYNRYRDYDPTTGRYIQADPIGLAGGQSPYSYAMGNPLRYTDPTGEFAFLLIPLAGAVGGAVFDIGIQGVGLWWEGCDPLDYRNYDKSSILISAAFGAAIPGPASAVTKIFRRYKSLDGAPRALNKWPYAAADALTRAEIATQAGRGGAVAGVKAGYDWVWGDE